MRPALRSEAAGRAKVAAGQAEPARAAHAAQDLVPPSALKGPDLKGPEGHWNALKGPERCGQQVKGTETSGKARKGIERLCKVLKGAERR